ncbi:histidine kinase [Paracrocinitomix mangrovi]|uniref:sensor histidine kinase n=1 Tax=Paracrocinitomix mangrovi TaxID=2862509 RepID=UPI001C8D4BCA|nr:sensor histidine kinase [Paracrocinitomix mangrovi]UKN00579.1 histidine kinase [Paracrocinitomix mangrovi]
MRSVLIIISIIFTITANCQDPAFFNVGKDKLSGVNIYHVNQDQNNNYWLATNNGLYRYNGYDFLQILGENMLSRSLFNVCIDDQNNVYCHNLSGQIFKVENDSCKLYFQIPDSLMKEEISIQFNDQNQLIVLARRLFVIHSKDSLQLLDTAYYPEIRFGGGLYSDNKGALMLFDYVADCIYKLEGTELSFLVEAPKNIWPTYFLIEDNLVGLDLTTARTFYLNGEIIEQDEGNFHARNRIYSDGENIWVANLKGGAKVRKGLDGPLFNDREVLSNYFISSLMRDNEGNIVIGTFRDGLLIIPNINASTYHIPIHNDRPTKIVNGANGDLLIGSQLGNVYELKPNGEMNLFYKNNTKFIEFMTYFPDRNELLVDDNIPHFIDLKTGNVSNYAFGAIKDVKQVDDKRYLIASNMGVRWIDILTKEPGVLDKYKMRTNAIEFNKKSGKIYAGTSLGLLIGDENSPEYYRINGQNINTTQLFCKNDTIFVCTQNKGVLLFYNDSLVESWDTKTGLSSNHVSKLIPYKTNFIMSTDHGVCIVSGKGKIKLWIGKPEGLTKQNVSDIAVVDDFLYVSHSDAVQRINLNTLQNQNDYPNIELLSVEVNDQIKNPTTHQRFSYNESKFVFKLSAKTLKYKSEIVYEYMLEGIDEFWQSNPYEENTIVYKSLPPGKYSFKYRTVVRGNRSEIQEYNFTIANPLWRIWWFWVVIAVLFLTGTYLYYARITARQRKLAENQRELISSKLTAIQSQMNPHFIFNSLNSIQDLVLREQGDDAYNYISKFAFLVRKVLEFSDLDFVEVSEELKLLKVYLELEQLRFKNDFEFEIESDDTEGIEIPPMIIQPFVENAIKHGLLHKSGKKKLKIKVSFANENIICVIEDNGVGRKKSAEINKRKSDKHNSFSVKSIRSRLDILKSLYGGQFGVNFEDLFENEEASGTRVILKLPFKRKF